MFSFFATDLEVRYALPILLFLKPGLTHVTIVCELVKKIRFLLNSYF